VLWLECELKYNNTVDMGSRGGFMSCLVEYTLIQGLLTQWAISDTTTML
jgi:hypothetical protein